MFGKKKEVVVKEPQLQKEAMELYHRKIADDYTARQAALIQPEIEKNTAILQVGWVDDFDRYIEDDKKSSKGFSIKAQRWAEFLTIKVIDSGKDKCNSINLSLVTVISVIPGKPVTTEDGVITFRRSDYYDRELYMARNLDNVPATGWHYEYEPRNGYKDSRRSYASDSGFSIYTIVPGKPVPATRAKIDFREANNKSIFTLDVPQGRVEEIKDYLMEIIGNDAFFE
tara:strand:- start:2687 stop:3367 length:681 start_codon:yes stop_codon:yes gene_type:complete